MKILLISQVFDERFFVMIQKAFDPKDILWIITSSNLSLMDNVITVKAPAYNAGSLVARLISWIRFAAFFVSWNKGNHGKFDLAVATSNPPINSFILAHIKRKQRTPVVYINWDIYPQIIEQTFASGVVSLICQAWHECNNRNYAAIDKQITLGDVMKNSIQEKISVDGKIEVVPYFADTNAIKPIQKGDNVFVREQGWQDKFVVLYSGKIGRTHNISLILQAADMLRGRGDIVFAFFGYGEGVKTIEEYLETVDNPNVRLFPFQEKEKFPTTIAAGSVGVVSQEYKLSKFFLPSKTYDMMAAGLPIIGICNAWDDLGQLIQKYDVGRIVSDNDSERLAEYIVQLCERKGEYALLREKARDVACRFFSVEEISSRYRTAFHEVL